jgi:TRAP-type C4-dicarboxylate transport system substrate-binding protein
MKLTRRQAVLGALAAPAILRVGAAQAATSLKISHQFPGGTIEEGDFRDRLCRRFASEVEKRTGGALRFDVYPNSSLMKTKAQFAALRRGALDMSLVPLAYAGGEVHACNIGLMPGLVTSYAQGAQWRTAEVGKALSAILESKGVRILSWIWQAGGVASRGEPVTAPESVKGIKIRGGSREMDRMFATAGAQVSTMPSNEIYIGMQTGALNAAVTSSTSLISFHLEELAKSLTAARNGSFWFMLEPLMISTAIFDALPEDQRKVIVDVGAEMEPWGMGQAKLDDDKVAEVYAAKGVKVVDFTDANLAAWRQIAETGSWKDFSANSPEDAELLKLALKVG